MTLSPISMPFRGSTAWKELPALNRQGRQIPSIVFIYIFRNSSNLDISTAGQKRALKKPSNPAQNVVACWK